MPHRFPAHHARGSSDGSSPAASLPWCAHGYFLPDDEPVEAFFSVVSGIVLVGDFAGIEMKWWRASPVPASFGEDSGRVASSAPRRAPALSVVTRASSRAGPRELWGGLLCFKACDVSSLPFALPHCPADGGSADQYDNETDEAMDEGIPCR